MNEVKMISLSTITSQVFFKNEKSLKYGIILFYNYQIYTSMHYNSYKYVIIILTVNNKITNEDK